LEKKLVSDKFEAFLNLGDFQWEKIKEGLSSKEKVLSRMQNAIKVFSR
jgi:hypothetical protein